MWCYMPAEYLLLALGNRRCEGDDMISSVFDRDLMLYVVQGVMFVFRVIM